MLCAGFSIGQAPERGRKSEIRISKTEINAEIFVKHRRTAEVPAIRFLDFHSCEFVLDFQFRQILARFFPCPHCHEIAVDASTHIPHLQFTQFASTVVESCRTNLPHLAGVRAFWFVSQNPFPTSWRVTISGSHLNVSRASPSQNAEALQASQQRKSPQVRTLAMIPAPARLRAAFRQKSRSGTLRHEVCERSNRPATTAVSAKLAQPPATAASTRREASSDRPISLFQIYATGLQAGPPTNLIL